MTIHTREAYEAATAAYTDAYAELQRARHNLELAELAERAAEHALAEQESSAGIPAYATEAAERAAMADETFALIAASSPEHRPDGCTCGGIGRTGSHAPSCQWSAARGAIAPRDFTSTGPCA